MSKESLENYIKELEKENIKNNLDFPFPTHTEDYFKLEYSHNYNNTYNYSWGSEAELKDFIVKNVNDIKVRDITSSANDGIMF